ncbi:MAG: relaxase/mobilization nuclease domain-containing protein, partial [Ginsengibacter sp.]
ADFQMQMEDLQKCYRGYARQLTIHAILSPAIEDGKRLTASQWKKIAEKYLTNMNMQELQAIAFLHEDKEHKHLHLVINKVKAEDFKLFHDSYIGKKTQKVADGIAMDMKLVRAMEIRQIRINEAVRIEAANKAGIYIADEKPVGTKQRFKSILESITKNKFSSIDEYFIALKNAGFKVHRYIDKETGQLRGYGIEMNGVKMDASQVGKNFTLKALNETKNSFANKDKQQLTNERRIGKKAGR